MLKAQQILLTPEGMKTIREKIEKYRHELLIELPNQLRALKNRGLNDLRENVEFQELIKRQELISLEIQRFENLLERATIKNGCTSKKVELGSRVVLYDMTTNQQHEYQIVSEAEADIELNKISIQSPCGQMIVGKKAGVIVSVKAPGGRRSYKILQVINQPVTQGGKND